MANSLDIESDDTVVLIYDLEKVFDIEISNEEAVQLSTVGELHDLLLQKISPNADDRKCATAMAFYRVHRALMEMGYPERMAPATDVRFLDKGGAKRAFKVLHEKTGLHLPQPDWTWIGRTGCVASIGGAIAAIMLAVLHQPLWSIASAARFIALGGGIAATLLEPGKVGRLAKQGARHSDADVWNALVEILSDYALPKEAIARDTYFVRSELKKHTAA